MPGHRVESPTPAATVIPAAVRDPQASADGPLFANALSVRAMAPQRKLQLGAPDDPLEHEADRVADQVMRMSAATTAQRACNECEEERGEIVSRKPTYALMRKCSACAADERTAARPDPPFLRRQSGVGSGSPSRETAPPPIVHEALHSPGQPLDAPTRAFFEPRFGRDFSAVRVYTDARAARAARLIDAQAYTLGSGIAFAAGRFDPASQDGRGLLAHELAHVVQQRGTTEAQKGDTVSGAGDPDERAAEGTAEAVLAGRRAPELAAVAPVVARSPDPPAAPAAPVARGFWIYVVVDKPVDGHEFCIRATMQGHAIGRPEAEHLLDSGALVCYGRQSTQGVSEAGVGHPIAFFIGDHLATGGGDAGAGSAADVELDRRERKEIEAEADRRLWARIGAKRTLSKDDPRDAAYRELWKAEFEAVYRERHPVTGAGSELDYDPFSSELRRFAAIGGMPAASEGQEIAPDHFWMGQVQDMLKDLTERDWLRLRRVGLPHSDWKGLAEWLPRFIAQQRADERAIAKVSALDKLGDLDSAYEAVHGAGRGAADPVEAEAYGRMEELNQAAGEFRTAFRTRALEIGGEMLRQAATAMAVERSRMQSRQEREALFAALARPTIPPAVLDDHPILRDPDTLARAHNPPTPEDLGNWLAGEAYHQAGQIRFVSEHLHEKPDVVFGFDVVVAATLAELGLQRSVHATIIQQGWGKSDGSSLFETLLEIGLTVLMFVPVIGPVIGAIQGFRGFDEAMTDYGANKNAFKFGMRTTAPSKTGVVLGAVGLVAGGIPIAHELSTTARSFGRMERLAAASTSEAGAAGRVIDDAAAARAGAAEHVEPVPTGGSPPNAPVASVKPGGEPAPPTEMRGVQLQDEAHSIQIRPAEVPVPATAAEITALRNTETSVLGRRADLARDVERLRIERGGLKEVDVNGEVGGLKLELAKRDKLLEGSTLSDAGKETVRRDIEALEKRLDAKDAEIAKLEAELSSADDELGHVRTRLRNEGVVPAGQPHQLAAGRLRESEVGEAFGLGPKNNALMRDQRPGGVDFIPDFVDGNPTSLSWGRRYHFREVKDWADMSDTGNLSAMLDYVSNNPGSRLTIYFRSNTTMSGPLTSRIESLRQSGVVDLVPFAGE